MTFVWPNGHSIEWPFSGFGRPLLYSVQLYIHALIRPKMVACVLVISTPVCDVKFGICIGGGNKYALASQYDSAINNWSNDRSRTILYGHFSKMI